MATECLASLFVNINKQELSLMLRSGVFIYEYAFIRRHKGSNFVDKLLIKLLKEYRGAVQVNEENSYQIWNRQMKEISHAMNNVTSVARLEVVNKDNLSLNIFLKACFRDIGDLLEGSLQPHTRLRLNMLDISGLRKEKSKAVYEMSFGEVISELLKLQRGEEYLPIPFGISISQWRNIAYHNSYYVKDNNIIICNYGKDKSIECTRADFKLMTTYIYNLYYTHKIAFEIFCLDNLQKINQDNKKLFKSNNNINGELEGILATGLVLSGFTLSKVGHRNGLLGLFLTDKANRINLECKRALQDALKPVILSFGTHKVVALVQSRGQVYQYSFNATIK